VFLLCFPCGRVAPTTQRTLRTTIVSELDREVLGAGESLGAERFLGAARAVEHRFDLPVDRLPPGACLLRFIGRAGTQTASREVRFVVR
jgi:hypothetical protein